ncbi:hypothetical protein OHA44_38105 [Streptomyces sp. NBC_00144]|uniref:PspA-associated protein PspAA n=1 Tax=unclassified Streptomyces TaxID=2593676 RepID=UPI00324758EC|nr:hypothetical protein OG221_37745 [Streptomyces sp. NBC_00932]
MIVRIMGEGQWTVAESNLDVLNALDSQVVSAVEDHDEEALGGALAALLGKVREVGTSLPDDAQEASDLVLPPSDASLDEVREKLSDSGLIAG